MMPRYAKKVDLNHQYIRNTLRELGFKVSDTSGFGCGFPDLMVGGNKDGEYRCLFVEVKSKGGKQTQAEIDFEAEWTECIDYLVVFNLSEILLWFGWDKETAESFDDA